MCVCQRQFLKPYRLHPFVDLVIRRTFILYWLVQKIALRLTVFFRDSGMYVCIKEYENVHKRHVQYKLNENIFKPIETSPHLSQQCKQRK